MKEIVTTTRKGALNNEIYCHYNNLNSVGIDYYDYEHQTHKLY